MAVSKNSSVGQFSGREISSAAQEHRIVCLPLGSRHEDKRRGLGSIGNDNYKDLFRLYKSSRSSKMVLPTVKCGSLELTAGTRRHLHRLAPFCT